ncbi:hypothetical protein DFP72DRAFT_1179319 [Ephemerocybe angulata]|uniref:Secreted protein n=1 Tax=Ephemerocybe angulata TaxID=980116 RepID=A0A8H6HA17_9AGAR|nr:hypothetical protein DFP72DRAFT_1179319 [Tulosesus angulatus]
MAPGLITVLILPSQVRQALAGTRYVVTLPLGVMLLSHKPSLYSCRPCLTPPGPTRCPFRDADATSRIRSRNFPASHSREVFSVVTLPYLIATDPKAQPKKSRTHADGSHAHHHHVLALRCRQQIPPAR